MASHHLLFSIALIMQVIIVGVYWTMLHEDTMARNKAHTGALIYQCLVHSLPALGCFYNLTVTDFIFYRGIEKLCYGLGVFYLLVNFAMTKITGNVTYWFLSWKDPTHSFIFVVIALGGTSVFIRILANITEAAKQRTLPNRDVNDSD